LLQAGHPLSGQPWETVAGALGKTLPDVSLGRPAQSFEGRGEDRSERHILTVDWSLPGHTLKSVSAYEEHEMFIAQDRDRTVLDLSDLTADSAARVLTQEIVLSSENDGALSYLVGAFYQSEDLTTDIAINNGDDYTTLLGGFVIPSTYMVSNRNNSSIAGFASTTYEFTDVLRGTLGVRYTEDTKEMHQQMDIPFTGSVVPMDSKKTFREWTYASSLQYDIDADKMIYFAYDVGFKSGGFNQQTVPCILSGGLQGCLSDDRLSFDPETTDSFQLGLKSEWLDGRVRLNGAVFYQTYEDYQVAEYLLDQAYIVVSNAAKVESTGIEFDLNAVLTEHWRMDASVTYADSTYDAFENAPCARPSQPGCVNGSQDLSGQRLDNAPRLTSNLSLTYQSDLAIGDGWSWFVRGDASYRGAANLYSVQDEGNDQGGYTIFNARLGIETQDGQWRATLWGNNLGDKEFAQTGLNDVTGVMMLRGLTRTYGLTVDWSF
jgi:iron complex outermembrane receptor protein